MCLCTPIYTFSAALLDVVVLWEDKSKYGHAVRGDLFTVVTLFFCRADSLGHLASAKRRFSTGNAQKLHAATKPT